MNTNATSHWFTALPKSYALERDWQTQTVLQNVVIKGGRRFLFVTK